MLASSTKGYQAYSIMPSPTWRDLVADTACYRNNKLKIVSKHSTNAMYPLVLCHKSTEDLLRQDYTSARHGAECFIGKLFQRAVEAFVTSQLQHCNELKVSISGNNYELFQGKVRSLQILAKGAVYKGVYLTDVQLAASDIKLKLRASRILQEPFHVKASVHIGKEDLLSSSLASPLLAKTLAEVSPKGFNITSHGSDLDLRLEKGVVQFQRKSSLHNLRFACTSLNGIREEQKTALKFQVEDEGKSLYIFCTNRGNTRVTAGDEHTIIRKFCLGPDVCIKKLEVHPSEIVLDGYFLVRP